LTSEQASISTGDKKGKAMGRRAKTRTTEITLMTSEVVVIKRRGRSVLGWCANCDREVRLVGPEEAVALSGVSARAIYRLVEAGRVHFIERPDGVILICIDSLANSTEKDGTSL
jgi:hypothetical protein